MPKQFTFGNRRVGDENPVLVIAEAGSNHDGHLSQAVELVDAAADAGADVVKFQLFSASRLYPANCGVVDIPGGPADLYSVLSALELPMEWTVPLSEHAAKKGLLPLFSVFDEQAVDALEKSSPIGYKIASPELTHLPLLRAVAWRHRPVILSTGMSSLGEVDEAVHIFKSAGLSAYALLHCVSAYPSPPGECNLNTIPVMAAAFDTPIGFSDHTLDPLSAPLVAVALSGTLIEKHFTLSRRLKGPDHSFALEPDDLRRMTSAIHDLSAVTPSDRIAEVSKMLGTETVATLRGTAVKAATASEEAIVGCDRRALHATADISPGEILTPDNVSILRGERNLRPGIHPRYWDVLIGAVASRDIAYGQGIVWDDVLRRKP